MDRVDETVQDVNNLYNLTSHQFKLLLTSAAHQICLSKPSGFTLLYQISLNAYNGLHRCSHYWNTFIPHLPIADFKQMLYHIEQSLPTTMHLPVSPEDTLHFCRYLYTHVLIANRQFLLLIDVPIQDQMQQISIYKIFTLDIPHRNFTAHYEINTKYFGITRNATMAVEISYKEYSTCKEANRQFCSIYTPFQPLANPPSCITALYSKNTTSIAARCSLQVRKTQIISIPLPIAPNLWLLT